VPRRILFLPQIADRKRICDRRRPDVVSGCDTASPARERERQDAPRRPGHLVNSILMCFCAPRGSSSSAYPRHDPAGAASDAALTTAPHVFLAHYVYTLAAAATPDAASAPAKRARDSRWHMDGRRLEFRRGRNWKLNFVTRASRNIAPLNDHRA